MNFLEFLGMISKLGFILSKHATQKKFRKGLKPKGLVLNFLKKNKLLISKNVIYDILTNLEGPLERTYPPPKCLERLSTHIGT